MAGYFSPYPYGLYIPGSLNTTFLPQSFPEHHYPLEHTRHAIAQGFHNAFSSGSSILSPRCDVRETRSRYYIDMEVPGIPSHKDITIKWTDRKTMLIEASKTRDEIKESPGAVEKPAAQPAEEQQPSEPTTSGDPSGAVTEAKHSEESKTPEPVHFLLKERETGSIFRAFQFPVAVSREGMVARLHHGVLRIEVPKIEGKLDHYHVQVDHDSS